MEILQWEINEGTRGLWNLITGTQDQIDNCTLKDMENYVRLLWVTSVLHHDFDRNNHHPRANGSWKWKNKLKPIWNESKDIRSPEDSEVSADEISGNGVFIQKGRHCYQAHPVEGKGLFLSPHTHHLSSVGDGLFFKHGDNIYDGKGLVLGPNSPFKNIPILGWIL